MGDRWPSTGVSLKVVRRGCKRFFWAQGAKVSQEPLAPCATLFCTGATRACTGARGFSLPRFKRPLAPSPNHFRGFSCFRPSPKRSGLQILAKETLEFFDKIKAEACTLDFLVRKARKITKNDLKTFFSCRSPKILGERRENLRSKEFRDVKRIGVHSLCLERETSTGVLANCQFGREFANLSRESANP